jgi:hypothetical protein
MLVPVVLMLVALAVVGSIGSASGLFDPALFLSMLLGRDAVDDADSDA